MPVNITKLNRFTEQLKIMFPDYGLSFKCPFCLGDFSASDVRRGRLCDAHIIPKKLGGYIKTIVCTRCDSRVGHEIEAPIINYITNYDKMFLLKTGKISGGAFISVKNELYPAQISTTKGKQWSIIMPDQSKFASFVKQIDSKTTTIKTLLQLPRKANDTVSQALSLKVAYLAAFEHYGYKYILQEELDWVRSIIKSPKSHKAPYKYSFMVNPLPFKGVEYVMISGHQNNLNAIMFLGTLGRLAVMVILPPLEKNTNKPFTGFGLTEKHQLIIRLNVNSDSTVTANFEFLCEEQQK